MLPYFKHLSQTHYFGNILDVHTHIGEHSIARISPCCDPNRHFGSERACPASTQRTITSVTYILLESGSSTLHTHLVHVMITNNHKGLLPCCYYSGIPSCHYSHNIYNYLKPKQQWCVMTCAINLQLLRISEPHSMQCQNQ